MLSYLWGEKNIKFYFFFLFLKFSEWFYNIKLNNDQNICYRLDVKNYI